MPSWQLTKSHLSSDDGLWLFAGHFSVESVCSASWMHRPDLGSPEEGPESPSLFEASDEDQEKDFKSSSRDASSGVAWRLFCSRHCACHCHCHLTLQSEVSAWGLRALSDHRDLAVPVSETLRCASGCSDSAAGVLKIGSICSGWGVGEVVVQAMNEALQHLVPAGGAPVPKAGF